MFSPGLFESWIIKNVTPFCHPLRDLIRNYRTILIKAFQTGKYEGIHDEVLKEIRKAKSKLLLDESVTEELRAVREVEELRRKEDGGHTLDKQSPARIATYTTSDD